MKQLIKKILKEESLKQTMLDQIKKDGWLETAELVGGPENLISVIGKDSIMDMLISCFKNLKVEIRGGDLYLMDGGLPILEKKASFWGLSLVAYHGYITTRLNQYLDYEVSKLYKKDVRRDFIRELVKRFPELYVEDVDVYLDSGLYNKIDSFSLESKNLKEGISRDRFDSEYADEYPKYKNVLITAIKMEITASGQTEESILLGNSYGEVFVRYRKPSRTLYYDYNWGEDIEKLMPWHIYTRHFKYALSDFFENNFPDVVIKNVTGAHIG